MLQDSARRTDVDITDLLASSGFNAAAARRARALLEEVGLTRPGKLRIAAEKVQPARKLLCERLARLCAACGRAHDDLAGSREVVLVQSTDCEVCAGSNNRRAGLSARRALHDAGVGHVLVVGGSPPTHVALRQALEDASIQVSCIDGTQGPRQAPTVEADLAWADVLVIWASTPLPHKVSRPYTAGAKGRVPTVTVPRRGVEAVCHALVKRVRRVESGRG